MMDDYTLIEEITFNNIWISCGECSRYTCPLYRILKNYDFTFEDFYDKALQKSAFICRECYSRKVVYIDTEYTNVQYMSRENGKCSITIYGELHLWYDLNSSNRHTNYSSPEYLDTLKKVLPHRKL